jgi:hypothetical protein
MHGFGRCRVRISVGTSPRVTYVFPYFSAVCPGRRSEFTLKYALCVIGSRLKYRCADKSLARPTFRCILFDGENISFDTNLVIYIYIYSTNIPPIMIINRIYKTQNILSL